MWRYFGPNVFTTPNVSLADEYVYIESAVNFVKIFFQDFPSVNFVVSAF